MFLIQWLLQNNNISIDNRKIIETITVNKMKIKKNMLFLNNDLREEIFLWVS